MLTWKQLKNLGHIRQEIEYLENKIKNYKPAQVVTDSVRGSSANFPYTEHSIVVTGIEAKKDKLDEYYDSLDNFKKELEKEVKETEKDIEKIPSSEIRQIVRYRYIEGMSYLEIMHKMGYNCEETPRLKLRNYMGKGKKNDI